MSAVFCVQKWNGNVHCQIFRYCSDIIPSDYSSTLNIDFLNTLNIINVMQLVTFDLKIINQII